MIRQIGNEMYACPDRESAVLTRDMQFTPSTHRYACMTWRMHHGRGGRAYWIGKRFFDLAFSLTMLIVLSPLLLLLALLVVLTSRGPAIYRHRRLGKNGRIIQVLKFRTMVDHADQHLDSLTARQRREFSERFKLENDPRVTAFGRFLRRTSLDELPQLVNIVLGEMSLVGPRPVVAEEAAKYGADRERFLSVTPGLTGYWQAYARSSCDYEQRMRMELEYVGHANALWDLQILLATCRTVLLGKGAE